MEISMQKVYWEVLGNNACEEMGVGRVNLN